MFGGNYMEYGNLLLIIATSIIFGIAAGIMGGIYRCILAYEPVLNWWFKFGERFEKKFFYPAVWGCQKCISGQICLWFYLVIVILPRIVRHWGQISMIRAWDMEMAAAGLGLLFGLILAVSVAIYAGELICKAINYKK